MIRRPQPRRAPTPDFCPAAATLAELRDALAPAAAAAIACGDFLAMNALARSARVSFSRFPAEIQRRGSGIRLPPAEVQASRAVARLITDISNALPNRLPVA